jgi:hypothetical protein
VVAVVAGEDDVGATLDEVPVVEDVVEVLLAGASESLPPHPTAKARSADPPSTAAAVLTWCGMWTRSHLGSGTRCRNKDAIPRRQQTKRPIRPAPCSPAGRGDETRSFADICGNGSGRAAGVYILPT